LLGYDRSELIGKNDYDFFPKAQADHFVARDREVLHSGQPQVTAEEAITTRRQGIRILQTTKVPVPDAQGRPKYLLGFSEDITERKAVEQQLYQASKMEAIGQLTGGVAHDFNNLLGVIIGNLDMALESARGNPTFKETIQTALTSALHGADLIQRLLAFSRKQVLQREVINLNVRLPGIASMLGRTLGEHITVRLNPGANLSAALVDPAQVDGVILNLAINARDAMPNGGVLTIETANVHLDENYAAQNDGVVPGDYVMLAVSDTGTGMAPEVLQHVFEPFFTTKEADKGTGLGLSMVYGFVKQSGGHIKISSELGRGTSVKINLPQATGAQAAPEKHEDSASPPAARGKLILVVEDNEALRGAVTQQLVALGYRVLTAEAAQPALALLDSHPNVDLLFSDVAIPGGMNGFDLARESLKRRPDLAILLTSGYVAGTLANRAQDVGPFELLNKPYRRQDLAVRLQKLLDGRRARPTRRHDRLQNSK
jgi:PAS domain S-box-containing protein